jgi:hypothetical protein
MSEKCIFPEFLYIFLYVNFHIKTMVQINKTLEKCIFHTNSEVAHSAHSWPFAQNSLQLFIYSWAPTISTILDRDPRRALKKVPLLAVKNLRKKWPKIIEFWSIVRNPIL